jgi:hypothetical protein
LGNKIPAKIKGNAKLYPFLVYSNIYRKM